MRLIDKTSKVSRRNLMRASAMTAAAVAVAPTAAFAMAPQALSEASFASLVKMARDIYPHDKLPDAIYAKVISGHDEAAAKDAAKKTMLEDGVKLLDGLSERMGYGKYTAAANEEDRVAVLKELEKQKPDFFGAVRGSLVTGLYNNQEVWPVFGYEGESAGKGGYIDRGFSDISWL
jgi:hypothetical protein